MINVASRSLIRATSQVVTNSLKPVVLGVPNQENVIASKPLEHSIPKGPVRVTSGLNCKYN